MIPDASFIIAGGRVDMVSWLVAIMAIITPQPRKACSPANSQNPHSPLMSCPSHMPHATMEKPTTIGMRASMDRASRPTSGPVKNMQMPLTSMVVPTSAAENCRTRPR